MEILELVFPDLCLQVEDFLCSWKCFLNALMLSESPLVKILMLTLHGFFLGVPSSSHLLKLALPSRDLTLFQDRTSASLIGPLERGV